MGSDSDSVMSGILTSSTAVGPVCTTVVEVTQIVPGYAEQTINDWFITLAGLPGVGSGTSTGASLSFIEYETTQTYYVNSNYESSYPAQSVVSASEALSMDDPRLSPCGYIDYIPNPSYGPEAIGSGHKFVVPNDGLYKLDFSFLAPNGINSGLRMTIGGIEGKTFRFERVENDYLYGNTPFTEYTVTMRLSRGEHTMEILTNNGFQVESGSLFRATRLCDCVEIPIPQ
jgi:hypothetical protein